MCYINLRFTYLLTYVITRWRYSAVLTDEDRTELFLKVSEMTATHSTVLGEEHELSSSPVAGRQHVL